MWSFIIFRTLCDVEIRGIHFIHVQLKLKHVFYIYMKKLEFQKIRGQNIFLSQWNSFW